MPGTIVHDANQPKLLDATLTANATGTIRDFGRPAHVRFKLAVAAVTGTTPTLDVEVQGSDSATFASGVVSYGKFPQKTAAGANTSSYLQAAVYKRYLRAVATVTGTTPSFGTVTLEVEEPNFRRQGSDSA